MNVRVLIQFDARREPDRNALVSLGRSLTNHPPSVRVFARDGAPKWWVVEFTMRTEAQYKAVDTIDRAVDWYASHRNDLIFQFPKSPEELERIRQKAKRQRARRRSRETD